MTIKTAKELKERRAAEKSAERNAALFDRVANASEKEIRRSLFEALDAFAPKCGVAIENV